MTLSQKGGRGNSEMYTVSNVRFFLFRKEKKTQKTKDVYIYDCYNFNWYILLNVKHIDRIPKWHTHSHTHKHEILGKLFVPCWPVYQSDEQMSPFTSNFTSDVTKNKERKKRRDVWCE